MLPPLCVLGPVCSLRGAQLFLPQYSVISHFVFLKLNDPIGKQSNNFATNATVLIVLSTFCWIVLFFCASALYACLI